MLNVCKPQKKYEMVNGELLEEYYVNLNSTIDHRYLDGALAAKLQKEVKFLIILSKLNSTIRLITTLKIQKR